MHDMKDSGVAWIGAVPSGYRTASIGSLFTIKRTLSGESLKLYCRLPRQALDRKTYLPMKARTQVPTPITRSLTWVILR